MTDPRLWERVARVWRTLVGLVVGVVVGVVVAGCASSQWADDAPVPAPDSVGAGTESPDGEPADPTPLGGDPAAPVMATWERYLQFHTELRGPNPSAEALDIHAYSIDDARFELALTATRVAFRGGAAGFVVTTENSEVTFRDERAAEIVTCLVEDVPAHWVDGALVDAEATRRAAWARTARISDTEWLVSAVDFERGPC